METARRRVVRTRPPGRRAHRSGGGRVTERRGGKPAAETLLEASANGNAARFRGAQGLASMCSNQNDARHAGGD